MKTQRRHIRKNKKNESRHLKLDKDRFGLEVEDRFFTFKAKFVITGIFEVFPTHYIERLKENIRFFSLYGGTGVGNIHPKTAVFRVPILSSVLRQLSSN